MKIACTIADGRGETNRLLAEVARELAGKDIRLCGTVQVDTDRPADHRCDMDVIVLPDGPVLRISQSLGPGSRGCRLDPATLEEAVGLSAVRLAAGADLLIVNKFGKHEAEGHGFRELIAEALSRDVPVLVGLNKLNRDAFYEFCPEADELAPDTGPIVDWAQDAVAAMRKAANAGSPAA